MASRQIRLGTMTFVHVLLLTFIVGCPREYDFERSNYERGTLGEELYEIWHKDTARSPHAAEARVELLERNREGFVAAIDHAMPQGELSRVDQFFQDSLVLVDEGYLPGLTRKAEIMLRDAAGRRGLVEALGGEYRPASHTYISDVFGANGMSYVLNYPGLSPLMAEVGEVLAASDGLDEAGRPRPGESTAWSDLLGAARHGMADFQSAPAPDRLPLLLQDILLVEDERFAMSGPATAPWYVVRVDERGFPKVRRTGQGLAHPFVDGNGDGLADIDETGRFILASGEPKRISAFGKGDDGEPVYRDDRGRAFVIPDQFVFEYVDLHRTALSYVMRAAEGMADEDVLYHVVEALVALVGPAAALEDARGLYVGFEAEGIADLAHAVLDSLDLEDLPGFLEAMSRILDHAGSELAAMLHAFDHIASVMDEHPEAKLGEGQTLVADLLPLLEEVVAHEELFHDVMAAFREPINRRGGEAFLTLLNHKDPRSVPAPGGPYDSCFETCRDRHRIGSEARFECIRACPMGELFSVPMELGAPEGPSNRSRLQRMVHLLRDTAATPYTMLVEEAHMPGFSVPDIFPPMIYLPGAAEAFVEAVAGELYLADYIPQEFNDSFLGTLVDFLNWLLPGTIDNSTVAAVLSFASGLFGVQLDTYPTPDQITRLFNQESLSFSNGDGVYVAITDPVCKDGYVMAQHHADGLFAAEAAGMIDILYPLARAFSAHGRSDLLPAVFVVIHNHYSSRLDLYVDADGNPSAMKAGNLVSFEPAMKEIFEANHLFEALYGLSRATANLKTADGVEVDEHLRRFLHRLLRRDDGFSARSGRTTVELADGRTLSRISRAHIILDELDRVRRRVEGDETTRDHLSRAWSGALGSVLDTEESPTGGRRFADEGGPALVSHALKVIADRARRHEARGELSQWLTETVVDDLEETLRSRAFFAALTLGQDILRRETMRSKLAGLFAYLAEDDGGINQSAAGLYLVLVEAMRTERWIPVLRFMTEMLDPDHRFAVMPLGDLPLGSHVVHTLRRSAQLDPEGLGFALIARALERTDVDPPMSVLGRVFGDYLRVEPGREGALSGDDYGHIFQVLADWLADDRHGMEQVFRLVAQRAH